MNLEELQTLITDYFSQQEDIDTVLIFGSFAKGSYNEHSDIDIAIHSNRILDYERLSKIQTELALLTHREIRNTNQQRKNTFCYRHNMRAIIHLVAVPAILVNLFATLVRHHLADIRLLATCPIEKLVDSGKGMTILQLFKSPLFWVAVVLMVCSGASELSMAQWASAFVESGLGLSKTVCDLAGPCLFAVTMGICRVFYGKFGDKVELTKFMIGSGLLCLICYIMASLSHNAIIALAGCVLCGFSVGIMWPGTG